MRILKLMFAAILFVCATTSIVAQKENNIVKNYPFHSFSKIHFNAVANIFYTQSDNYEVRVEGDSEMIKLLKISEKGDILTITTSKTFKMKKVNNLYIYVSSPNLKAIVSKGVGNWEINKKFFSYNFDIQNSGVGNIDIENIESSNISIICSGVGNITLRGKTKDLNIKSKGVGFIDTHKLKAENATVSLSGAGNVSAYASESVDLRNSGVGNILYSGNPSKKNITNRSIGKITNEDKE